LKLNELIAVTKNASNRLIDVEDLSPQEPGMLKNFYVNYQSWQKRRRHKLYTYN